jgi:hypothetical protein
MSLAEELRAGLQEFLIYGNLEIREGDGRITPQPPISWEVRGASGKPLLHLWAENCNLTRRVLAITDQSAERMALAVERFGKTQPQRLDLVRLDFPRSAKKISREEFCEQLRRILAEQFPDESVEKLSIAADLEHSLSRVYARGVSRKGSTYCAFLAVPEGETQDAIESSLTYALLWLDRARQSSGKHTISFLRLILPAGTAAILSHRLRAVHAQLAIQVFELNLRNEQITRIEPCADGNLNTWLIPRRESETLKNRANGALAPIVALMPDAISIHAIAQEQEVVLRFRGLTFARWSDGRVYFGIGTSEEELTGGNENKLKRLVAQLQTFRHPLASDMRHPFYRAQAERWMQCLVTGDIARIDIQLDPIHVYEQVFARAGRQHGVLDLLVVTQKKRLAILELKATEDPDLPLQAADYWTRIRRHQAHGDLCRYGFFPGMELQSAAPILYLVAPELRFHPTTSTILSYLNPEIEVVRVGLAESWRRGLRVMRRH